MRILLNENFHCLNNAYIDNETHSPPNIIHIIFDDVHRDNACDIQKASTERVKE